MFNIDSTYFAFCCIPSASTAMLWTLTLCRQIPHPVVCSSVLSEHAHFLCALSGIDMQGYKMLNAKVSEVKQKIVWALNAILTLTIGTERKQAFSPYDPIYPPPPATPTLCV